MDNGKGSAMQKSGRKGKDVPCREWQWQRASDGNVLNGPKQQEDMWGWRRVSEERKMRYRNSPPPILQALVGPGKDFRFYSK